MIRGTQNWGWVRLQQRHQLECGEVVCKRPEAIIEPLFCWCTHWVEKSVFESGVWKDTIVFKSTMGQIFFTEIKILNHGTRDISQKLRQTECLLFNFWMIRLTKHQFCQIAKCKIAFFGVIVHFALQILKIIHLVCLSFWNIPRDPGFRILISVHKIWPFMIQSKVW